MPQTVIADVLTRLSEIGVDDVFGVAGDYGGCTPASRGCPLVSWHTAPEFSVHQHVAESFHIDACTRATSLCGLCDSDSAGFAAHGVLMPATA